jgi:plasmid stability protein
MQTTIDLPDPVLRRLKVRAAVEGSSRKQIILRAVEKEWHPTPAKRPKAPFPLILPKDPVCCL